jgi:hypothetical protein
MGNIEAGEDIFVTVSARAYRLSCAALLLSGLSFGSIAEAQTRMALAPVARESAVRDSDQADAAFQRAISLIRAGQWDNARSQIETIADRNLASFARAELFLASGSPRVEGDALRNPGNSAGITARAPRADPGHQRHPLHPGNAAPELGRLVTATRQSPQRSGCGHRRRARRHPAPHHGG